MAKIETALLLSLTKYEVIEGRLEERQSIKLDAYGIRSFVAEAGVRIDIVSDTKAYRLRRRDAEGRRLGPVEHDDHRGDRPLRARQRPLAGDVRFQRDPPRGDQLVVFMAYEDFTQQRFASDLRVALIDTRTDAATILRDERCAALYATSTSSGDIYFSSDGARRAPGDGEAAGGAREIAHGLAGTPVPLPIDVRAPAGLEVVILRNPLILQPFSAGKLNREAGRQGVF